MSLEGVLNIDKPVGITSHDAVMRVRRLGRIRRVGHAGTLDPLASGVLLVCVGRATRLVEYLVGHNKRYEALIRLGQTTNTYDAEGEILTDRPVSLDMEQIARALTHFRGRIEQRAPIYSAIKQDGQPLYKLARQGKSVEPPVRQVEIIALDILAWEEPFLSLAVACSSGTYIRSLAHDLGSALGCGGYLAALRRTAVGQFTIAQATALDDLQADKSTAHLQPSDVAASHLPRVDFSSADVQELFMGRQVPRQGGAEGQDLARAYGPAGDFAGIVIAREENWQPHKIFPPAANDDDDKSG